MFKVPALASFAETTAPTRGQSEECAVKGIMFKLLQELAGARGCTDDAWELVIEFAAAEFLLDHTFVWRGTNASWQPRLRYDAPAEAMVRCLSRDTHAPKVDAGYPLETAPQWFEPDEQMEGGFDERLLALPPVGAGFSAEAFLCPRALMDVWERDTDGSPDDMSRSHDSSMIDVD